MHLVADLPAFERNAWQRASMLFAASSEQLND